MQYPSPYFIQHFRGSVSITILHTIIVPRLPRSTLVYIGALLELNWKHQEIANTVGTTVRAVERANRYLKDTSLSYRERAKPGPDWKLDSLELCQFFRWLALKPDSDQEEMCQYIWDQFHVVVSAS